MVIIIICWIYFCSLVNLLLLRKTLKILLFCRLSYSSLFHNSWNLSKMFRVNWDQNHTLIYYIFVSYIKWIINDMPQRNKPIKSIISLKNNLEKSLQINNLYFLCCLSNYPTGNNLFIWFSPKRIKSRPTHTCTQIYTVIQLKWFTFDNA